MTLTDMTEIFQGLQWSLQSDAEISPHFFLIPSIPLYAIILSYHSAAIANISDAGLLNNCAESSH
jgi:hypothetical protein